MAVRSSAVASVAPSANIVNVIDNVVTVGKTLTYSKAELLELNTNQPATSELKVQLGRLQLLSASEWTYRLCCFRGKWRQCLRKQKRGKRARVLAKLKASASRPGILSLFLSNVHAMDLLRLRLRQKEIKGCCVTVLTKTWLSNSMPDSAFKLDDWIFFHLDHNQLSAKTK